MAVPAGVGASFEVVQAEAVFEFAVVVFDAPADLGQLHECGEWRVGGQGGQPSERGSSGHWGQGLGVT